MNQATLESRINRFADRFFGGFARWWNWVFACVFGVYVFLAVLAPLAASAGVKIVSTPIYFVFRFLCHQLPSHSFFLNGQQLACCQRCTAIYGSAFLGSILFAFVGPWLPKLTFRKYLLLCVPMALDGLTQLFGWRESTWELRVITGSLFALGGIWWLFPLLKSSMAVMGDQIAQPGGVLNVGPAQPVLLLPEKEG